MGRKQPLDSLDRQRGRLRAHEDDPAGVVAETTGLDVRAMASPYTPRVEMTAARAALGVKRDRDSHGDLKGLGFTDHVSRDAEQLEGLGVAGVVIWVVLGEQSAASRVDDIPKISRGQATEGLDVRRQQAEFLENPAPVVHPIDFAKVESTIHC